MICRNVNGSVSADQYACSARVFREPPLAGACGAGSCVRRRAVSHILARNRHILFSNFKAQGIYGI